ncbi:MAG: beta-ketoacyl-ACP synthase II [Planctomycetota bacterium]|jgi:3-oxoacyl-[acyl-carrier-protein] synthase II
MSNTTGRRRVVVTGIGILASLGNNKEDVWQGLMAGKSGIAKLEGMDASEFSVDIGGEVRGYDASQYMDKRDMKKFDRFVQFAMGAAGQALEDSGIDTGKIDQEKAGCIIGSGVGGILSMEDLMLKYSKKGASRISPLTIPKIMVNCASGLVAINHNLKGINYGPVTACASGSHAIGLSMRHIQWGEADVVLCGGAEAGISILGLGGFSNMSALSSNIDNPQEASRPFDKDRDGFVIAEGAGLVVLEELEHAKARGADIYAEILGYGFTDDAFHITSPTEGGEGAARAMSIAIKDSGLTPTEIDYVNAHGTSTPYNDKNETAAIKQALGEHAYNIKVSSTKSMTGHMLGAAGGMEFGLCAMMIERQKIHGTLNYTTKDPECDLDYAGDGAVEMPVRNILSNSLGFGGHNASLCLGQYTE